jgi:hypothetical protein
VRVAINVFIYDSLPHTHTNTHSGKELGVMKRHQEKQSEERTDNEAEHVRAMVTLQEQLARAEALHKGECVRKCVYVCTCVYYLMPRFDAVKNAYVFCVTFIYL